MLSTNHVLSIDSAGLKRFPTFLYCQDSGTLTENTKTHARRLSGDTNRLYRKTQCPS